MRPILFLFMALASFGTYSQRGAYNDGSRKAIPSEILSISISPLSLLDMYNGSSYKAGLTIRPLRNVRLSADAGGYWKQFSNKLSFWQDLKGYNFRASAGIYLGQLSPISLGVEYSYKSQEFNYNDSVPDLPGFTAHVNKFVHVFNVYGSFEQYFTNRFYIELRAGIGLRYRDIYNTHSDALSESINWWDSMTRGRITTMKKSMPNLNFAIRLNYILWEN